MDLKDRKLIYLLDKNSREKESVLAKKLLVSKQVVNYRIKKLTEKGIIKQFQTVLNLSSFGADIFAQIYIRLTNCDDKKQKEILKYLLENKKVYYVGLVSGNFDICITLLSSSIQEFEHDLNAILSKYSRELSNYDISLRSKSIRLSKKYLFQDKKQEEIETKYLLNESSEMNLKKTDREILKIISSNSRETFVSIGNLLNIPFSTVREKIKNLERKKVILGYSTLLDVDKMGLEIHRILIKVNDKSQLLEKKIFDYAVVHKNFVWVSKTFGTWDYELRVNVNNQKELMSISLELRQFLGSDIETMEYLRILEDLKEDYSLLIDNFNKLESQVKNHQEF